MKTAILFQTLLCLVLIIGLTGSAKAGGDKLYAVNKIPLQLGNDADAVVRNYSKRLEVKSERKAYLKETFAITIFNKHGRGEGELTLPYDKNFQLESLEGKLFDADGNELRDLEKNDIMDVSATGDENLYDDARVRHVELYHDHYPYTVEYTYEYYYKGYLNWPSWNTRTSIYPVEQAMFEVIVPTDIKLRYWCNSDTLKPLIQQDGSKTVYTWKAEMQPELSKDSYGEDIEDLGALVHVAPVKFEIEDHPGSMETWKDFGSWYYELFKDRDELPDAAKKDVHNLVDKLADVHEKIAALYAYMQKRSRYISIQLGIGSWQPFDAKYVHERGYGDCKALSNYMKGLLREAGITAYPVLIEAGRHRYTMITEFPSNQFGHMILTVPLEKDTVWLECTSNLLPAGELSEFTENRNALMLTPLGGVVVHTPVSIAEKNLQIRKATVSLFAGASGRANIQVLYKGNGKFYTTEELAHESPEDKRKWVINSLGFTNFENLNFNLAGLNAPDSLLDLNLQTDISRFYTQTGPRIFFQPNLSEKETWVPAAINQRFSPIRFGYPYIDIDTITYILPTGCKVEALPKAVNLKTSFGSFDAATVSLNENTVRYVRKKEIDVYEIPAKNYPEYRKFYTEIVKSDRAQAVLLSDR